jgi:imidazolonepropionase-like amidohydrolase
MLENTPDLSPAQQADLDMMRKASEARMDNVARMVDAGVVMTAGSDTAWGFYQMGDFQTEIEAHAMAGMSNMQAIVSATRDAARSCWIDDSVGTLEPGKQGDVLVVNGNPDQDINALRNIADVYLAGNRVDRQALV